MMLLPRHVLVALLLGGGGARAFLLPSSGGFARSAAVRALPSSPVRSSSHIIGGGGNLSVVGVVESEDPLVPGNVYSSSGGERSKESDPRTMQEALAVFTSHPTPKFIAATTISLAALRLNMGSLEAWDLFIVGCMPAIWAVQEYVLHRFLLHSPQEWVGSEIHVRHHETDYFHVCIDPLPLVASWLVAASLLAATLLPTGGMAVTWMIAYSVMGMAYEFTHFIAHLRLPSSEMGKFWQARRSHHAAHHLRDASTCWAFIAPDLDEVLGTKC
jgi:hypothetical protein